MSSLLASRAVFVSGKGGVGKTTVASALALASARLGAFTLLAEVEQREGIAPAFGFERLGHAERVLEPDLVAISIEPDESLVEYLQYFYKIPRLSRPLIHSRAVEFATQVAPGLRDILLVGRIKEAEVRRADGGVYAFDQVIVDAPPTGRLPRFLDAPRAITDIVASGPIGRQAAGVRQMLMDPARAQVVLVTQPDELPLQETLEALEALRALGIAVGPVVCNQVWPGVVEEISATDIVERATLAGMVPGQAEQLAAVVVRAEGRANAQRDRIAAFAAATGEEPIILPFLFTAELGRGELDTLARVFESTGRLV